MMHFFLGIFKKYIQWILKIWIVVLLLDLLLDLLMGKPTVEKANLVNSIACLMFCIMCGTLSMNWIVFWRRMASSIKEFWLTLFVVQIFNFGINIAIFLLISKIYGVQEFETQLFQSTGFDSVWALIIFFSTNFVLMNINQAQLTQNAHNLSNRFIKIIGIYFWLIILFFVFSYSRLLGYFLAEISILLWFLHANTLVLGSIQKSVRLKIQAGGVICILAFTVSSYVFAKNGSESSQSFLGSLVSQKKTHYTDLQFVDTPSSWVRWFKQVGVLETDQKIAAIAKLEALCPPQPTDTPTTIECFEKNPTENGLSFGGRIENADSSKVSRYLSDSHVYVKLLGLMHARGLSEFSPEIKEAISALAISGGRLSPVAELTLRSENKNQKSHIRINIVSSRAK